MTGPGRASAGPGPAGGGTGSAAPGTGPAGARTGAAGAGTGAADTWTRPAEAGDGAAARLIAWVEGRVQGVGFRWWVRARALERGLAGWAENLTDGRVKVVAEGPAGRCGELLALLTGGGTPGRVRRVTHRWDQPRGGLCGFTER